MEEWKLAGAMLGRIPLTYPISTKERRNVPRGKNAGGCEKITAGTTSPYVYGTCQGSDPQVHPGLAPCCMYIILGLGDWVDTSLLFAPS